MSKKELKNMQKPKAESTTKTKNTPVTKVAPSPKPTAFVIPSIMVDPGTPKATLKATAANKPKESIVIPTESEPEKEPVSAPAPIPTISTPEPEVTPEPAPTSICSKNQTVRCDGCTRKMARVCTLRSGCCNAGR